MGLCSVKSRSFYGIETKSFGHLALISGLRHRFDPVIVSDSAAKALEPLDCVYIPNILPMDIIACYGCEKLDNLEIKRYYLLLLEKTEFGNDYLA